MQQPHTRGSSAHALSIFDLLLKRCPGSRGSNPASVGGTPRGNGTIRRGKTNAPTEGVNGPGPGTSPHRREGKNRRWVAPVCKGAWDAADTLNRSEASGTQPSALSTQTSFPHAPPTPTLGGAVMLLGTLGAVTHQRHPRSSGSPYPYRASSHPSAPADSCRSCGP